MKLREPKNTEKYYWTEHVKFKMKHYGLGAQRVLGVINNPKRKEEGIVKNTIAVMKPVNPKKTNGKENWKQEIWVMYQIRPVKFNRMKIISAWRYPGVSPKKNPVPEEVLAEIENIV